MKLSDRILSIEGSKTARFIPLVEKLRWEGRQVISLAIGEPTVDTPAAVVDATKRALDKQKTRYSDMAGLMRLRAMLAGRFTGSGVDNITVVVAKVRGSRKRDGRIRSLLRSITRNLFSTTDNRS